MIHTYGRIPVLLSALAIVALASTILAFFASSVHALEKPRGLSLTASHDSCISRGGATMIMPIRDTRPQAT